jgi:hypothetical protein
MYHKPNIGMKKHPLEEDVRLSDGSVVRVTGLLAVQFRENPEAVRKFVEEDRGKIRQIRAN